MAATAGDALVVVLTRLAFDASVDVEAVALGSFWTGLAVFCTSAVDGSGTRSIVFPFWSTASGVASVSGSGNTAGCAFVLVLEIARLSSLV